MKKIIVSTFIITSTLIACKTAEKSTASAQPAPAVPPAAPLPPGTLTYVTDIKPIIEQYCTRCHGGNETGGYDLGKVADVKRAGMNGALLGTIKHADPYPSMPPNEEMLDNTTIAKIEAWIKSGMN